MTTETELVAALKTTLSPTPVFWGWAPFESAEVPPQLPLVTVRRLLFATGGYDDMCEDSTLRGDTTLVVHAWSDIYADARALTAAARDTIRTAGGWTLQSETDTYDPTFRAWQIEGQWLAGGVAPE
jgi:hypothetical protein